MIDIHRLRADEGLVLKQVRLRALTEDPQAFRVRLPEVAMRPDSYWEELAAEVSVAPGRATFLAEFEGRPVGMVGAEVFGEGLTELRAMWTEPLVRRRGAGRRLVDAVVAWARDRGCEAVELWVVRDNEGAQRLYRDCGFRLVDGLTHPDPDDPCAEEIRMRLDL